MLSPVIHDMLNPFLNRIWKLKIPHYVQFFIGLVVQEKILTNVERMQRHMIDYADYGQCSSSLESSIHLCRDCKLSREFWRGIGVISIWPNFFNSQGPYWWEQNLLSTREDIWGYPWNIIFSSACWCFCKWRNLMIF